MDIGQKLVLRLNVERFRYFQGNDSCDLIEASVEMMIRVDHVRIHLKL
jgi:hypothetical protein